VLRIVTGFLPSQLAALAGNRGLGLQESRQLNVNTNYFKLMLVKDVKLECGLKQKYLGLCFLKKTFVGLCYLDGVPEFFPYARIWTSLPLVCDVFTCF
jgi:hypothetical protein